MRASSHYRRKLRLRVELAALLLLLQGGSTRAEGSDPAPLSWAGSVSAARANNPELQAATRSLAAAHYSERGAYNGFFPQASLSMGMTHNSSGSSSTALAGAGGVTTLVPNSRSKGSIVHSATITISQNLFSGFTDLAKVEQAGANRRGASASQRATIAKISYDLKSAFANLAYAQKAVTLTKSFIERRQNNYEMVELRFTNGGENKGSVLLSEANLGQAKFDYLQANNALSVSRTQMARVLGIDRADEVEVIGTVPVVTPPPMPDLREVAEQTPDLLQARAQEEAAEAAVVIARGGFFPSLSLSGNTANSGDQFFQPGNSRWSVGLSLTIPFFRGGQDYYGTLSAVETRKSAILSRENVARQSFAKLRQAYAQYQEAVQKYEVDRSFSEASTTRAMISREKYNNGLLTFEDWDIIESDVIARQKAVLQSERDRIIAEAAWEQAQGKGVF